MSKDLSSSFPKNLAYSISELNSFSKQNIKILSDRMSQAANAGDLIKFKLPPNTLLDMRTFSVFGECTITEPAAAGACKGHMPRYSSSLIEQVNIYINNTQVSNINSYNLLYNMLADFEMSSDNINKRFLEVLDPSIIYTPDTTNNNWMVPVRSTAFASTNDTSRKFVINNWINFINNASTLVWDTNDLGDVIFEFRLAPAGILWGSAQTASGGAMPSTFTYSISNIRATVTRISFNSSEYYELKAAKLLSDGLMIGFQDFVYAQGTSQTNANGTITWNYNVNANSLDYILATFRKSSYATQSYLQLANSANYSTTNLDNGTWLVVGTTGYTGQALTVPITQLNLTFSEALANPHMAFTDGSKVKKDGDLFNQSGYFQRYAPALTGGQFQINGVMIDTYQKPPEEVYNEALINLGLSNLNMNGGVHQGLNNLVAFLRYYFVQVCSLSNLANDGKFWRSGLNGQNSSINVQYAATFQASTANADTVIPIFFNAMTKIMIVNAGRIINVV